MGNGKGGVAEEWLVLDGPDELHGFLGDEVVGVGLAIERHLVAVAPKVVGIEGVSLSLAVVAVEAVKSLIHGITLRTGRA